MTENARCRVAILYPGDREAKQNAAPEKSRFWAVFQALTAQGMHAEPAVYHDDFCDEVRRQLMQVDGVLVWVNPIEGERDRSVLDAMLREVAALGVFVSTHPDVILKLGTKEVLYRTRDIGWGCDTHLYRSMDQLRRELPSRLAAGKVRVSSSSTAVMAETVYGRSSLRPMPLSVRAAVTRHHRLVKH